MLRRRLGSPDYSDFPLSTRLQIRRHERARAVGAAIWGGIQALVFMPFVFVSLAHPVAVVFFGMFFALGVALLVYGIRDARIAKRNEELERSLGA